MYKIVLHKKVITEDIKELGKHETERIFKAIKNKLTSDPISFGKPLKLGLKNYFRLRIDFYRVVYKVKKQEITVFIIKIGKRKDGEVYEDAMERILS